MISIKHSIVEHAITIHKKKLNKQHRYIVTALKKIKDKHWKEFSQREQKYLVDIIREFSDNLVIAIPEVLKAVADRVGLAPPPLRKNKKKKLPKLILEALSYEYKRTTFYPDYFRELGIRSCVYCNSQLAVNVDRLQSTLKEPRKERWIAKYQLDHYYPKDHYPFLAVSLYNLYPVCGSCNISKGTNLVAFELYTQNFRDSPFRFSLDAASMVHYMLDEDSQKLKIKFVAVDAEYDRIFHVSSIYNTQQDIAEELILKALIYNKEYKQMLTRSFAEIFHPGSIQTRMLLGNYAEPSEILRRPMSKFMQDIGKDLGLI